VIEHCKHCGKRITFHSSERGPWNTGWHHNNGYNVCDPGSEVSSRGEPNHQLELMIEGNEL